MTEAPSWVTPPRLQLEAAEQLLRAVGQSTDLRARLAACAPGHAIAGQFGDAPCASRRGCLSFLPDPEATVLSHVTFLGVGGQLLPVAYVPDAPGKGWVLDAAPGLHEPGTVCQVQAPTIAEPLLSFVHLTDVQLRDATAKIGGIKQSQGLDSVIDSFEHDFDQELFLDQVLRALVARINGTIEPAACAGTGARDPRRCPSFVIHGGDAIDAGLVSELRLFHSIMDELRLPWLDQIGNHDVLAFGNLIPGKEVLTRALLSGARPALTERWYWPLLAWASSARWKIELAPGESCPGCEAAFVARGDASAAGFIAAHREHQLDPRRYQLCAWPRLKPDELVMHILRLRPDVPPRCVITRDHGFDLTDDPVASDRGYYRFDLPLYPRDGVPLAYRLRVIVLDTTDYAEAIPDQKHGGFGPGGEGGYMSGAQLEWFDRATRGLGNNDLVLVFGHHTLQTIRNDGCAGPAEHAGQPRGCGHRLQEILERLASERHLVAYVVGHQHGHQIDVHGDGARAFWQVETASLIGFPQEARWVSLFRLDDRIGFLELQPFGVDERTGVPGDALDRARRGARRDYCRKAGHTCVDGEPVRHDGLHGEVRLFFELPGVRR